MSSDQLSTRLAVRVLAASLGVQDADVRAALAPLRAQGRAPSAKQSVPPKRRDAAVEILSAALHGYPLKIRRVVAGRPFIAELEATGPVAIGEGVIVGDDIDDAVFRPLVMKKGDRRRGAIFRTAARSGGNAQFTLSPPREGRDLYSSAFFVLVDEARVWNAHAPELASAAAQFAAGEPWLHFRVLGNAQLRLTFPSHVTDWDLHSRIGPPPRRVRS